MFQQGEFRRDLEKKMSGGFTNFAGGSVAIETGGTAAGQFGRITINGSAALAGTLNLSAVNGFDPGFGSTFNVMTYTSHTEQFDTVNPFDAAQGTRGSIGNGKQFAVTYGASGLTVNTVAPSTHSASLRAPAPAQGARASPLPTPAPVAPVIKSITKVDDSFHIEFQSIAGRSYRIEWTDNLVTGKWTMLTNEAIAGTGALIKVIDAGAGTQKQGFYRVVETKAAAMKKPLGDEMRTAINPSSSSSFPSCAWECSLERSCASQAGVSAGEHAPRHPRTHPPCEVQLRPHWHSQAQLGNEPISLRLEEPVESFCPETGLQFFIIGPETRFEVQGQCDEGRVFQIDTVAESPGLHPTPIGMLAASMRRSDSMSSLRASSSVSSGSRVAERRRALCLKSSTKGNAVRRRWFPQERAAASQGRRSQRRAR